MQSKEPRRHGSTILPPGLQRRREAREVDPELTKPSHVRVKATQEKYRRHLRHGITKQRFLPDINQSVEWPNDVFTTRRLQSGVIVLDDESQQRVTAANQARDRQMRQTRDQRARRALPPSETKA